MSGGKMKMRKLYTVIANTLSNVNFEAIWKGFSICEFALYNQETVYFKDKTIPWDNRFIGNTAIEFEGDVIAIWSVESPETEDTDYLAAAIVHEMFHAFQKLQGETRYPNDLKLLAYPDNIDNYQIKMVENGFLAKALSEKDIIALKDFVSLRRVRTHLLDDVILQEFRAETVEGMAEYAGLLALEQINKDKFKVSVENNLAKILRPTDLIFSPRRLSYYTGAILCLALKFLKVDFQHELNENQTLFEIVSNIVGESYIDVSGYINKKKKMFDEFLDSHSEIFLCDSYICGYDPMNMIRFENKILCNHFVVLGDEFIQGPVIVVLQKGSANKAESYIK